MNLCNINNKKILQYALIVFTGKIIRVILINLCSATLDYTSIHIANEELHM